MTPLKYLKTEPHVLPNGIRIEDIYVDCKGNKHVGKMEEDLSASGVLYHSESLIGGRHAIVKGEVLNGEEYIPFRKELKAEDHARLIGKLGCLLHAVKSKYGV